jgi:hypothetical protein
MTSEAHAQHNYNLGLAKSVAYLVSYRGRKLAAWASIEKKKVKPTEIKRTLPEEWALRTIIAVVQASAVLVYCFAVVCHVGL